MKKTFIKAVDGFEYSMFKGIIRDGDWLYNTLKNEVFKVDNSEKYNKLNNDYGHIFELVEETNNPEIINDGYKKGMSDVTWYYSLSLLKRTEYSIKYTCELSNSEIINIKLLSEYIRKRVDGVISDEMAALSKLIKVESYRRFRGHGMGSLLDEKKYTAFIEGAEWAFSQKK